MYKKKLPLKKDQGFCYPNRWNMIMFYDYSWKSSETKFSSVKNLPIVYDGDKKRRQVETGTINF